MFIIGLGVKKYDRYALKEELQKAIDKLVGTSSLSFFLDASSLLMNVISSTGSHLGSKPTIVVTIPDTYHDEPKEFLNRLRAELSLQEELQFAGIYSKLHTQESEEGEPYIFTTIETVFLI